MSYDSLSGRGFIIGSRTRNIIGYRVNSKLCSKYIASNTIDTADDYHICKVNWEGASEGIEIAVVLELFIELYDNSGR